MPQWDISTLVSACIRQSLRKSFMETEMSCESVLCAAELKLYCTSLRSRDPPRTTPNALVRFNPAAAPSPIPRVSEGHRAGSHYLLALRQPAFLAPSTLAIATKSVYFWLTRRWRSVRFGWYPLAEFSNK